MRDRIQADPISADRLDEHTKEQDEHSERQRLTWLSRPRIHPAIFEEGGGPFERRAIETIEAVVMKLGWSNECLKRLAITYRREPNFENYLRLRQELLGCSNKRFKLFKQLAIKYRREPNIENYLRLRHEFPEIDIRISVFSEMDVWANLGDRETIKRTTSVKQLSGESEDGLVHVQAALDAAEPNLDEQALRLLEALAARDKLPKDGPGHIKKRREAMSDATVNFMISIMLESFDWQKETLRIPASLIVLIRRQLCGEKPDLYTTFLAKRKRMATAFELARRLKPGEKLSIRKLMRMTGLKRDTAARWLKEDFSIEVAQFQECDRRLGLTSV